MADEDQERVEDYLELERYIEELQAGHVAHPPTDLAPDQAHIYRMAALFRSASPEAAEPRSEFIEELRTRLLSLEDKDQDETDPRLPVVKLKQEHTKEYPPQEIPQLPVPLQQNAKKKVVSRRALLTGGTIAAASLALGTGIGITIDQTRRRLLLYRV